MTGHLEKSLHVSINHDTLETGVVWNLYDPAGLCGPYLAGPLKSFLIVTNSFRSATPELSSAKLSATLGFSCHQPVRPLMSSPPFFRGRN